MNAINAALPRKFNRNAGNLGAGLIGVAVLIGLAATYWPTVVSVEAIWRRSPTFAHGYFVVPIAFWLVWLRRSVLAPIAAAPFWPALAVVAAAGMGWTLGKLANVIALEQFSLYVMMIGAIVTVLGTGLCREMAFPLAFLAFAVPFGEFLVPVLIDRTADFTLIALQASGVPVFREGNDLTIPSGRWSVIDACSGIRYLIASVMVGSLYAYLSYQSVRKRLAFLIASIIVPIVANWLRAYMIVMLGHLTNNRLATGIDHFIYGWVFFGMVIMAMFWVGSFWRDVEPAETRRRSPRGPATPLRVAPVAAAAVLALAVGVAWRPLVAAVYTRIPDTSRPLAAIQAGAGWQVALGDPPVWTPHFVGPHSEIQQWFAKNGGIVGVYVALYSRQSQGRELIEFRNQLVDPEDRFWKKVGEGERRVRWDNDVITVQTADIAGARSQLSVRAWYWVNGRYTPSDGMAKALQAFARLTLRPDYSAVIVIYTSRTDGGGRDSERLDQFSGEMGAVVMQTLRRATTS